MTKKLYAIDKGKLARVLSGVLMNADQLDSILSCLIPLESDVRAGFYGAAEHLKGYKAGLLRAAEIARKYTQPVVTKEEVLLPKTYKYQIEGFNKACEAIATAIEKGESL